MSTTQENHEFNVQEKDGYRILTFHETDMLPVSNLSFATRLRSFFKEEERLLSEVLLVHVPDGFLDHQNVQNYWGSQRDREAQSKRLLSPQCEPGMEHLRGENVLCQFVTRVRSLPKFVICALEGEIDLSFLGPALACDYRILSAESTIVNHLFEMGTPSAGGLLWFLVKLLGETQAMDLVWSGRPLRAEEALGLGLVHRLVPPEQLDLTMKQIAHSFATRPRAYLAAMKRAAMACDSPLDNYLKVERQSFESWAHQWVGKTH